VTRVRYPAAVLAGVLSAAVLLAAPDARAVTPRTVTLVYTAELRGNIVPCSCPARALGGLARRIGWVDSLRAASMEPLFVVDAGSSTDLAQTYPGMPPPEQDRLERLLDEGDRALGYDARAGGADGPPRLPPNQARRIVHGGAAVVFVAVDERVDAAPALPALRQAGKADLVVLLCSGDTNFALSAAKLLQPDVAVVARGATFPEPLRRDGVLFLGPGVDGKYVGYARITLGKPARAVEARLRAMDASVGSSGEWEARVETEVLAVESRHPGALVRGE
jgi:hypothetical protein